MNMMTMMIIMRMIITTTQNQSENMMKLLATQLKQFIKLQNLRRKNVFTKLLIEKLRMLIISQNRMNIRLPRNMMF